jgi:hypothetical protein
MTPELFIQWKKKKIAERDAGLAAQQAERAKNDRMRYILPHVPPLPKFVEIPPGKMAGGRVLYFFAEHVLFPSFQWT